MTQLESLDMWKTATANAKWGVQQAIKTSLELVADEQIKICWGQDDYNGAPCLINSINQMLSHNADHSPSGKYPNIVRAFDLVNADIGINKDFFVSPIAAEILLRNMGEMKPVPVESDPLPTPEEFLQWARERRETSDPQDSITEIASEVMGE